MESEREGRQSGAKEREMGDIVVFWECFVIERGRGWSLTSKRGEGRVVLGRERRKE